MPRIGPKMIEATRHAASNPGCPILTIAEEIGPYGSRRFGYAAVHRAAKAGLIRLDKRTRFKYACYVTEKGVEALTATH